MFSLLRRLVVALEVQAECSVEARDAWRKRESQGALDREEIERVRSEANALAERQQATLEEAVRSQTAILETYRQHIADCERWHKQAAGVPVDTETVN